MIEMNYECAHEWEECVSHQSHIPMTMLGDPNNSLNIL